MCFSWKLQLSLRNFLFLINMYNFLKMLNLLIEIEKKKEKPALLTRTCSPGLALASPDMTEVRVLVQFRTFRVQS